MFLSNANQVRVLNSSLTRCRETKTANYRDPSKLRNPADLYLLSVQLIVL